MNAEQIEWARKNLQPGTYIAQLADANWREPFIHRSPEIKPPRTISDEEAARSVEALNHLPVKPAEEYQRWQPEQLVTIDKTKAVRNIPPVVPPASVAQANRTAENHQQLDNDDLSFLDAVIRRPGQKSSKYSRLAGLNGQRSIAIRRRLVELGYLRDTGAPQEAEAAPPSYCSLYGRPTKPSASSRYRN